MKNFIFHAVWRPFFLPQSKPLHHLSESIIFCFFTCVRFYWKLSQVFPKSFSKSLFFSSNRFPPIKMILDPGYQSMFYRMSCHVMNDPNMYFEFDKLFWESHTRTLTLIIFAKKLHYRCFTGSLIDPWHIILNWVLTL